MPIAGRVSLEGACQDCCQHEVEVADSSVAAVLTQIEAAPSINVESTADARWALKISAIEEEPIASVKQQVVSFELTATTVIVEAAVQTDSACTVNAAGLEVVERIPEVQHHLRVQVAMDYD